MAPPSVGVAMPRKMVPSTRKISASGGISTKVTRSAMRESRPSFVTRLMTARAKAMPTPTHMETTISSSVGVSAGRDLAKTTAPAAETMTSASTERKPALPLSSRMVRASSGKAGAAAGLIMVSVNTQSAYRPVSTKPGMKAPA